MVFCDFCRCLLEKAALQVGSVSVHPHHNRAEPFRPGLWLGSRLGKPCCPSTGAGTDRRTGRLYAARARSPQPRPILLTMTHGQQEHSLIPILRPFLGKSLKYFCIMHVGIVMFLCTAFFLHAMCAGGPRSCAHCGRRARGHHCGQCTRCVWGQAQV